MLSEESLQGSGWQRYAPPAVGFGRHADAMYQLRIKDDDGKTLFFVQLYRYAATGLAGGGVRDRWSAEVALIPARFGEGVEGSMLLRLNGCERLTPDEVVRLYREVYDRLGCVPGRHNQG